jgi:hypothetical protein
LIVVAVIYLTDCVSWAGADTIAFVARFRLRWRPMVPRLWVGNGKWGPVWHLPLPPLGRWFLSQLWPISVSPQGIYSDTSHTLGRDVYPQRPNRYMTFSDVREVQTLGRELHINGRRFAATASEASARQLAELIGGLVQLPESERSAAIAGALDARMNTDAVGKRLAEHDGHAARLRILCNYLFVWVFVVVPLMSWTFGWLRTWPSLLAGGLFLIGLIAWRFVQSHAALFPEMKGPRREKAAMMVLNPLAAIRAHDALARDALAAFHPLAVASVLCSADEYRRLAQMLLVDLHHPLEPLFADADAQAREVGHWFHMANRTATSRLIESTRLDAAELLAPDPPLDATCRAYCPHCRCQFVIPEGLCVNCGGIPLEPFART